MFNKANKNRHTYIHAHAFTSAGYNAPGSSRLKFCMETIDAG